MVEGGGRSGRDGHVIYRHSHTDTKINHVQDLCISYACSYIEYLDYISISICLACDVETT